MENAALKLSSQTHFLPAKSSLKYLGGLCGESEPAPNHVGKKKTTKTNSSPLRPH